MKATITIQMGNAAFEDEPHVELSGILCRLSDHLELNGLKGKAILDSNGNKVGDFDITE